MWLPMYKMEHTSLTIRGDCALSDKPIKDLQIETFSNCSGAVASVTCNTTNLVTLQCMFNYITSTVAQWIHSRNGQLIRTLGIQSNPNLLTIPFCTYEEAGEYTCIRSTSYLALRKLNETVKLAVKGPPIVLEQFSSTEGNDLVLSVIFFAEPEVNETDWLTGENVISSGSQFTISRGEHPVSIKQYSVMIHTKGIISNLTVHNFHQQRAIYTCRINNGYGIVKEDVIARPIDIQMDRNSYCDTSSKVEIRCIFEANGAKPGEWMHSVDGTLIRKLNGIYYNNTNILVIHFCNYQDIGSYTCFWEVEGGFILNKTTTLAISGPPVIIGKPMTKKGNDTVISVSFYSHPYPEVPQWYYNSELVTLGPNFLQTTALTDLTMRQHGVSVDNEGFITYLTVSSSISTASGTYICQVSNSFGSKEVKITIEKDKTTDVITKETEDRNVIIIVSSTCSALVVVVVIVVIIIYIARHNRKKDDLYSDVYLEPKGPADHDSRRMSKLSDIQHDYIQVT